MKNEGHRYNFYTCISTFYCTENGNIILIFSQKIEFDISCKLETICIKWQILFSGKNIMNLGDNSHEDRLFSEEKNINLLSAEFAQRMLKIKVYIHVKQMVL